MKEFIDYAFYGSVVGHSVDTIEKAYDVYCKLVNCEHKDEIVNRICNEYNLFIDGGKLV